MTTASGREIAYDALVLATGSYPFVPPVPGHDLPGCFVYRTLDDLDAIRAAARRAAVSTRARRWWSAAACSGWRRPRALRRLGLSTHVVEFAPRLMPLQVDEAGGEMLRRHIEDLGVTVHARGDLAASIGRDAATAGRPLPTATAADAATSSSSPPGSARGTSWPAPAVWRSVSVAAWSWTTAAARSDPDIYAIGECACVDGRVYGLVAPGYAMAEVVADRLTGGTAQLRRRRHCPPSSSCSASTSPVSVMRMAAPTTRSR